MKRKYINNSNSKIKPFIINPVKQSLMNNETVIFSETFEDAIKTYAEQRNKTFTETWFDIKDKPRNANLNNSFQIRNRHDVKVFALLDNNLK